MYTKKLKRKTYIMIFNTEKGFDKIELSALTKIPM